MGKIARGQTQEEVDQRNKETSQKEVDAFLADSPKKYIAYAFPTRCEVGTWTGQKLGDAKFAHEWQDNCGSIRQSVYIKGINGKYYYGIYFKSGSDIVRFREIKS